MFGCIYKWKKGSHHILTYPGAKRAVVIPEYEEVDVEIIKNNMRTVGMTREQEKNSQFVTYIIYNTDKFW